MKSKKIISFLLMAVLVFGISGSALAADSGTSDFMVPAQSNNDGIAPHAFLTLSKGGISYAGIVFTITYTYNDAYDAISGFQSATITSCPDNVRRSSVTCTPEHISDDYILFNVEFYDTAKGAWRSGEMYMYK